MPFGRVKLIQLPFGRLVIGLLIRAGGMLLGFWISLMLAKHIGSEGLGLITLSMTTLGIVTMVCFLGTNNHLARAIPQSSSSKQQTIEILNSLLVAVGLAAIAVIIFFAGLGELFGRIFESDDFGEIITCLSIILLPAAAREILSQTARGYGRPLTANAFSELIPNLLRACGLVLVIMLYHRVTVNDYAGVVMVASLISVVPPLYWVLRNTAWRNPHPGSSIESLRSTLKASSPFFWISSTYVLGNAIDTIMIGYYLEMSDVAYYGIAAALAGLLTPVLTVSNSILSPTVAAICKAQDHAALNNVFISTRRHMLLVGALPLLMLVVYSQDFLALWGEEFKAATNVLLILAVARYTQLFSGNSGLFLTMLHRERYVRNILWVFGGMNIILNAILVPMMGITGAAIATAATLLATRLCLHIRFAQELRSMRHS